MKIKTSELIGPALDWAVAKCEGLELHKDSMLNGVTMEGWYASGFYMDQNQWVRLNQLRYSTSWSQGGPIIDREKIDLEWEPNGKPVVMGRVWLEGKRYRAYGPTPLIAAMRCYTASKLGDEVDIPEELK